MANPRPYHADAAEGVFVFDLVEKPDEPARRLRYDLDDAFGVPPVLNNVGEAWSVRD